MLLSRLKKSIALHGDNKTLLTLFYPDSNPTYFICPPMISREKKFLAQFLLQTQKTTQNRVTHRKPGLYLKKQKNGGRFKIAEWDMLDEFRQYFAFFTSSH